MFDMKTPARCFLLAVLACSLSACLFKQPVYTTGFLKIDPGLAGVWVAEGKDQDPRKMEFAVCAPLEDERCILHSPAADKDGIYYEARMLKIRDRHLLQLRVLATFKDGLLKPDDDPYTLLWLEGDLKGPAIRVLALDGNRTKGKGPADVKRLLESPSEDWNSVFGDATVYRRLKDN
jgi:hypothetical protein